MKISIRCSRFWIRAIVGIAGLSALAASAQDLPFLVKANNSFGFNLLQQIVAAQPGKNIFISPFSASCALQMVADGAAGETRTEMEDVLKTAGISPATLKVACRDWSRSLTTPRDNVTLEIANSVWYRNDISPKPNFVSDNKNYFQAGMAAVNFSKPKTADLINGWADRATHGKIQKVVQFPFPDATAFVLADAIYFKGKWLTPFEGAATQPRDFHLANGGVKRTPMMERVGKFNYEETADFQAVQLPYEGGLRMELFLTKTNSNPQELVENFRDGGAWTNTESGFHWVPGVLTLPRFKMSGDVDLNKPLENLGMKLAFLHGHADFSSMTDDRLAIDEVQQSSYVVVDEQGTEAAAVTTGIMTASAAPRPQFTMTLDHPFVFTITDDNTQTILFVGILNNPVE